MIKTIEFGSNGVVLLVDQRKLPAEEVIVECTDYRQVADAITKMVVRGAPAIGVTAAGGIALGARGIGAQDISLFKKEYEEILKVLGNTRPTGANLFRVIERMKDVVNSSSYKSVEEIKKAVIEEANRILEEDIAVNERIGLNGQGLIEDGDTVLTHCNAGALATAGNYGTALGVIKVAHLKGKRIKVFAGETRPFLQGARLTTWEMQKEGIDVTLITDNMAGHFMKKGMIGKVLVGADRIARNGDTANKIGTYAIAVLARAHRIPFYVAAPLSTIDFNMPDGEGIPIEERNTREVSHIGEKRIVPEGVKILNPAFDITPNEYIELIITERGVAKKPFTKSLELLRQG